MDIINKVLPEETSSGQVIRSRRKSLGLTVKELAGLTRISQGTLSDIENDKKKIGQKIAEKIGAALGLHPSIILWPNDLLLRETKELKEISKKSIKLIENKAA
jgi:transcriptional regulator with XRE-family HTH domain